MDPTAHGRALFETHCAPCHGPTGGGLYEAAGVHAPRIAGAPAAKVERMVRHGGKIMPAFPAVALPDDGLADLAAYVHGELAAPAGEPARVGPRELDPFLVGLFVWGALALLALGLALLFGEGRN